MTAGCAGARSANLAFGLELLSQLRLEGGMLARK